MDVSTTELSQADLAVIAGNLSAATGGAAPHQALRLMRELAAAAGDGELAAAEATGEVPEGESAVVAALEAAIALAPRDPLEGMLVAQMAAVHAAAMRCLMRAAECAEHPKIEASYLRLAARLLHLFVRQAEALDRRARRMGGAREAEATDAAGEAGAGEAAAPDGAAVLEKLLADIHARRRESAEAEGDAGEGETGRTRQAQRPKPRRPAASGNSSPSRTSGRGRGGRGRRTGSGDGGA
jgi:hypothetical protein